MVMGDREPHERAVWRQVDRLGDRVDGLDERVGKVEKVQATQGRALMGYVNDDNVPVDGLLQKFADFVDTQKEVAESLKVADAKREAADKRRRPAIWIALAALVLIAFGSLVTAKDHLNLNGWAEAFGHFAHGMSGAP
jgi:hypothetical protein